MLKVVSWISSMIRFVWLGLFAGLLTGCGASTGTVQGTVTFQGQAVENGEVRFEPASGVGSTTGAPIAAGKFSVPNLLPGTYKVTVEVFRADIKITLPGGPESQRKLTAAEMNAQANPLPPDTVGKEQTFEVKPGEQTMTFTLTSPSARS